MTYPEDKIDRKIKLVRAHREIYRKYISDMEALTEAYNDSMDQLMKDLQEIDQ